MRFLLASYLRAFSHPASIRPHQAKARSAAAGLTVKLRCKLYEYIRTLSSALMPSRNSSPPAARPSNAACFSNESGFAERNIATLPAADLKWLFARRPLP
ncbi:hypothetical protein LVJ83_11325 [Uruburuella testudinis]|uniref:Uncharacterized protein n=1 Tax=Uruburuella testudinis TaxID=1282863 RepID=A0ABY4DR38_9NEIS|nr:hypothetical protein [Uruburuella testudinis]UOO81513.1 hypothetical protein LVJ83_11325 [Uruburuella testudinis]